MKKADDIKFPSSASLFQFCRRVLDTKFGGVRVIDQDVGTILGFDPADCSHWKKGKKNIRSIHAMKAIANALGVDERLVVDIASGELSEKEAYFEYNGYGSFEVDMKLFEGAKKDYFKRHASSWTSEREAEFRSLFQIDTAAIDEVVKTIHERIQFKEAPLYIPEVLNCFPEFRELVTSGDEELMGSEVDGAIVVPAGSESRPYLRFRVAKAIGSRMMKTQRLKRTSELPEFAGHVNDVEANIFAAKLLAPASIVRREMQTLDVAKDLTTQLAEVFWVSKTFMNRRLKEILQTNPEI